MTTEQLNGLPILTTVTLSAPVLADDYLPPKVTAVALRTTTETLCRMRTAGSGPPYIRVGSRVLYARRDLDTWLASRRHSSRAAEAVAAAA